MKDFLWREKLERALQIISSELSTRIERIEFREYKMELFIQINSGETIFIRYNNFGEYGYTIIFSRKRLDRIRFDNFDDLWDVHTRPHHLHPKYKKKAVDSVMTGDPTNDIQKLCKYILDEN